MRRRHAGALGLAFASLLVVLAAAWVFGPLSSLADPVALARSAQRVREWPFAPLVVVAVYVALGLVAAPGSLLVAATTLTFGAWPGALYAFVGMLANAIAVYTVTRRVARDAVERWVARRAGSRIDAINALLARRGAVAVLLMRLTPFPYSLQSALAGAARVAFGDFVIGTAVGILPVITVMAGIASQWDAWVADPEPTRLVVAGGIAVAAVAAAWAWRRIATRRAAASTRRTGAMNDIAAATPTRGRPRDAEPVAAPVPRVQDQ